jgi:hypothetical protein
MEAGHEVVASLEGQRTRARALESKKGEGRPGKMETRDNGSSGGIQLIG